jgi:uncharacterized RDD family membrane protein YckC
MQQVITVAAYKKASFWKRLIALYLDTMLVKALVFIATWLIPMAWVFEDLFAFVLYYSYAVLFDYYYQGTMGKLLLNIKVVGVEAEKPALWNCFCRNFGKMFSALPFCYGFLRILAPHHKQTIHDEFARCLVVEISKEGSKVPITKKVAL